MIARRRRGVVGLVGGVWGYTTLDGRDARLDPSKIATVERGTMTRSVVATGKIEPITKVEIKSKANGIIEQLHVDVDQVVDAGEVLAELDKENLTRPPARGARQPAGGRGRARRPPRRSCKKNRVEAEAPDVEFARRNYDRAQQLFDAEARLAVRRSTTRKSALELAAEPARRAAQVQLVISQAKVAEAHGQRRAGAGGRRARRRGAGQRHHQGADQRAPCSRATSRSAAPCRRSSTWASTATLVMTLGDIDQVFVRGKVDEADIGRVRLGQPARITVETFKDKMFDGSVTQISPIGVEKDNVTTFEVKVSIDNPGKELKANMTANAEIVLEEFPNSLIVPEAAISYDAQAQPVRRCRRSRRQERPPQGARSRPASATARRRRCSRA